MCEAAIKSVWSFGKPTSFKLICEKYHQPNRKVLFGPRSSDRRNCRDRAAMSNSTLIHCTQALRDLWPSPLATLWRQQYPNIIDEDDLRITTHQPSYHFCEWFAAIHLFQRDGVHALIEKYIYANHPKKISQLSAILGQQKLNRLMSICEGLHVQPPDLFLYVPGGTRCGFAEIKGPKDRISDAQLQSHVRISEELDLPVEIFEVAIR